MTTNKDPIFLDIPKTVGVKVTAADTTTKKTAFTANSVDGGAVVTLQATSADAADSIIILSWNDGTTSFQIGEITVPAGAGTNGTLKPVNLFNTSIIEVLDADGSFVLEPGGKLEVAAKVTVAGDIEITGIAGNY